MVLLVVACYNWEYAIGFSSFTDLYESIVSNYAWINNIIGQYSPFGYWNTTEIIMVLLVASGLIAWLYSLKLKDACDAFVSGCKKALRPAIYVALASVIIYAVLGTSTGNNIYFTISNAILGLSESVHALVMSLFSFVSGLFLNDYSYLIGYMTTPLTSVYTDTTMYSYMALILQIIHGFVMLFVPTSLLLVGGLSYLKINYKELYKIVGYLDEDKNEIVGNIDLEVGYKKVPLYSSISAGYGACDSGVIDYIALPMVNSFSGDIFAVRVNGDSMEHTIENHSIVFIKRDSEVANKKIGAFLLNNEALLKRYYVTENGVFLRSDNRDYPDIRVREHDDFIIVGRYIGSVINEDEI